MKTAVSEQVCSPPDMTVSQKVAVAFFAVGFLAGVVVLGLKWLVPEIAAADELIEREAVIGLLVSVGSLFLASRS